MAEQQISLTDLEPIQLQEIKKQLDQQLKSAQAKFKACISDIGNIGGPKGAAKGKEVLVPLTSSLYVPGKLSDVETVLVDVGTGYYVKKVCYTFDSITDLARDGGKSELTSQTRPEAIDHYTSKSTFIQSNLETLQKTIERKQENVQSVIQVLQMKMQGEGGGQAVAA